MTEGERQFALALTRLDRNPDFHTFLDWLKGNSWWGQGPFDAANFESVRAAHIEGRQSLIRATEAEIEAAKQHLSNE